MDKDNNSNFINQFTSKMDEDFLREVSEVEKAIGDLKYGSVPDGVYEVRPYSMEVKKSRSGNLMLASVFKVTEGQYEQCFIKSYIMLKAKTVYLAINFLKSLGIERDVYYESEIQFTELVENIFYDIKDTKIYQIEQTSTTSGFTNIRVVSYKTLEEEELPFA